MMNNKGFMKFEVLTMVFIFIVAVCGGGYFILKGANGQKINTMSSNGLRLSEVVVTNISSFKNLNLVYLDEVINEKLIDNIKNPFGGGNCDATESSVEMVGGDPYTTLKCGDYLIDKQNIKDVKDVKLFKVSKWQEEKIAGDNVEERVLYNCEKDGKNLYDEYLEEGYLVAKINQDFDTNHYFKNTINECDEIVEKTFYRTKEEFN